MSIIRRFNAGVKKYLAEADERAEKRLAKARTKASRESEKAKIQKERLRAKREIAEAKTALLKSEAKRKKAAKEVRDLGDGGIFSGIEKMLRPSKPKKKVRRRKPVSKVTPCRKPAIKKKKRKTTPKTKPRSIRILLD